MSVTVETIAPGDGKRFPQKGDFISINYVGKFADGTVFDASNQRGKAFVAQIGVGAVIRGWDIGIPKMSVGQRAILTVPPKYAYGGRGWPPVIPPNSTLTFEVHLVGIN